jgi:hypothetical protein
LYDARPHRPGRRGERVFWLDGGECDLEIIDASAAARSIDAPEGDQTMAREGFFCGAASLSAQQTAMVLNKESSSK